MSIHELSVCSDIHIKCSIRCNELYYNRVRCIICRPIMLPETAQPSCLMTTVHTDHLRCKQCATVKDGLR